MDPTASTPYLLISLYLLVAFNQIHPTLARQRQPALVREDIRHAERNLPFNITDIPGLYTVVSTTHDSCSRGIEIRNQITQTNKDTFDLPHSAILQDSHPCNEGGSVILVTSTEYARGTLQRQAQSTITSKLLELDESFAVGIDRSKRICGTKVIPPFTQTVFTRPRNIIVLDRSFILQPPISYMLIYNPSLGVEPCIYIQSRTASQLYPSPTASYTPLPSPSAAPSRIPLTNNSSSTSDSNESPAMESLEPDESVEIIASANGTISTSSSSGACFPASARVLMADGSEKRIDSIRLGEEVQDSRGTATKVYAFSHRAPDDVHYDFVRIVARNATCSLTLSSGHYMLANGRMVAAAEVRPGDIVVCHGKPASVQAVTTGVTDIGLFNVHTISGDVVVNGIVASTYTKAIDPKTAAAMLSPVRAAFKVIGRVVYGRFVFDTGRQWLLKLVPAGRDTFQ